MGQPNEICESYNVSKLKDLKKTAVYTSGSVMGEGGGGEGLLIEFYLKGVATIAVALVGILGNLISIRWQLDYLKQLYCVCSWFINHSAMSKNIEANLYLGNIVWIVMKIVSIQNINCPWKGYSQWESLAGAQLLQGKTSMFTFMFSLRQCISFLILGCSYGWLCWTLSFWGVA